MKLAKAMLKPFLTFISDSLPVDYHSIRRTNYTESDQTAMSLVADLSENQISEAREVSTTSC
jgi:hypothetical protein